MKMTLGQISKSADVINMILDLLKNSPTGTANAKLKYSLFHNLKSMENDLVFYYQSTKEIYDKCLEKDNDGNLVEDKQYGNGGEELDIPYDRKIFKIKDGFCDVLNNEISNINNIETNIAISKFDVDLLIELGIELDYSHYACINYMLNE